jgi:hypothetical protein
MPERVTIPIAAFELSIRYTRPVLNLWLDRAVIVQAMFDALSAWQLNVDDVEVITTGKPSEQGVKFNLASRKISFFFSPAGCKFTKEAATWAEADETLKVLDTALELLTKVGGVELGNRSTSLALHVQPKIVPFRDLLRPFLAPAISQLENTPASAMAFIIRWNDRRVTLDGSAALANGVFLRSERDFDASVSLEDMKATIYNDELTLLKLLNVEEVDS